MTDLLTTLTARGFVHDATPALAERLHQGPICGYVGFDPTAPSLHVGNLVPVMGLAWLQRSGGTPIVLVGGGTGLVGDPSGKRAERPVLPIEEVDANAESIRGQLERFLRFDGPGAARMTNNAEWLRSITLLEFLRDTGKHFTLGYMLQKESVKSRLDAGISFTEFAYMLVQAYDFHHLYATAGCELQMGGSDQWGNITAGIELVHRRVGTQVHGLVFPLLTTASGSKFGKTEAGNIWLDPTRTSPYQFYQFWLNAEDEDVGRLLRFFTFRELDDITSILSNHVTDPGRRHAQRTLAAEVTGMVHGVETVRRVERASNVLFGGDDLGDLDSDTLSVVAGEVPCLSLTSDALDGMRVIDALVQSGLAASKSEARRGIEGKGFSVNGSPVTDTDATLQRTDLRGDRYVLLRKGKKHWAVIEIV